MSNIERYITRRSKKDTAVYWGNPTPDGFGTYTYDDPVEINVFWLETSKTVKDNQGVETISQAIIFTNCDLVIDGYLYHGALNDLDSAQLADPKTFKSAYRIMKIEKRPSIQTPGKFGRQYYI